MEKVWSNRFDSSLNPFIEKFNASINFDKVLILEDIECSIAHAKMLGKTKVLTALETSEIIRGLVTIKNKFLEGSLSPGAPSEDIHYFIEEKLIQLRTLTDVLFKKVEDMNSRMMEMERSVAETKAFTSGFNKIAWIIVSGLLTALTAIIVYKFWG